ncbi:DUF4032 domain-containing protein [Pontimonas sp.]|jgi:hypothetical protein|nr:DUF4032 domain-containing protein [Pontimonas sp.]MDA8909507.1 DUF4032 domain-containing protein [Pontimonas sp.]|tara:strand:+ start:2251 stop:3531 length:1281 start_codon:yes stop_codon:yes gene_type:complete
MSASLSITASMGSAELLELPWDSPLEKWPKAAVAALPKGISRHIVRFVHLGPHIVAIKETTQALAVREYDMLRKLDRLDVPCVEPVAIVSGRTDHTGDPLPTALVTRHLRFSLPYRALYSQSLRPDTARRLADALAALLVRLHIVGFFWGDVSLSNTLFRRDAGAFAAYLVDAETGELMPGSLSDGQRENDLEIARVNVAGELLDLQAGGRLDEDIDPLEISESILLSYRSLWDELTGWESFDQSERWRIAQRVQRLNDLGFDIENLSISTDESGSNLTIQPKVVDAGHHTRRLLRLTGIDAGENQARRLLNDLDAFRAFHYPQEEVDEEVVAHEWLSQVYDKVMKAIPKEFRGKLEPAEIFHQWLEHRGMKSREEDRDVGFKESVAAYMENVLAHRRDEAMVTGPPTEAFTLPNPTIDVNWRDRI